MIPLKLERLQLPILVLAFTVLAIFYVFWIPAGEGVDEVAHFQYIRYVKENRRLPVQPTQPEDPLQVWMGHHPPLYYALTALILTGQDTSAPETVFVNNPHFTWSENNGENGWNVMIHAGQDQFPGEGIVRTFFLARLLSILYGLIALIALFRALRLAFPNVSGLPFLATSIVVFNPSFVYMSSTIHHDVMLTMWFALGTWWMMHFLNKRSGYDAPLAGVLIGCAILTKISGVVLAAGIAVVIVCRANRDGARSILWRDGLGAALLALLVSGGWFLRNRLLYGDILGWNAYSNVFHFNLRPEPSLMNGAREFLQQASRNFWGGFGFMHITFPEIGSYFWIATAATLIGWLILTLRNKPFLRSHRGAFVAAAVLLGGLLAAYIRFAMINLGAGHGRYLFPAAFAIGLIPSVGLYGLFGQRMLKWLAGILSVVLFIYALWLPYVHVLPKYAPPTTVDSLPSDVQPLNQELGDGLFLAGYELQTDKPLVSGSKIETTLYWRVSHDANAIGDPRLALSLETPTGDVLDRELRWPTPSMPPQSWRKDSLIVTRDTLRLPAATLPVTIQVRARTADADTGTGIMIAQLPTAGGASRVDAEALPDDLDVTFGEELKLRGVVFSDETAQAGETILITLFWLVLETPDQDHTTFLHLLDEAGNLVTQLDRPTGGFQTPTSTWKQGQAWEDTYPLVLPETVSAGNYVLQTGMYDWPALERIPIDGADNDVFILDTIEITAP